MSAYLEEVIAGIISSLVRAKVSGDIVSLEIAEIYKRDNLLRHLPVPKINIDKIEIELKAAIESIDKFSSRERAKLILEESISNIEKYKDKYPQIKELKENLQLKETLEKKIEEILTKKEN